MADNLSRGGAEARYPNGDPFAELSRIIGAGTAERRADQDEASFDLDLERELLGEDPYEPQAEAAPRQHYDDGEYRDEYRDEYREAAPVQDAAPASADPLDDEFADAFAAEFGDDGRWRASAEPERQGDERAEAEAPYAAPPHVPHQEPAEDGLAAAFHDDATAMAEVDLDFGDIDLSDDMPALEAAEEPAQQRAFAPAPRPSLEDELSAMLAGEEPEAAPHLPLRSTAHWDEAHDDGLAAAEPEPYQPEPYEPEPYQPEDEVEAQAAPEPQPAEEPDPFAVLAALAPVAAPAFRHDRVSQPVDAFDVDDEFATAPVAESAVPRQDELDLPDLPIEDDQPEVPVLPLDADYHFGDIADAPAPDAVRPAASPAYEAETRPLVPPLAPPLTYDDDYGQTSQDDVLYAEYAADQETFEEEIPAEPQAVAAEPVPERRNRGALIAAALVGVALVGGIGAFALSSGGGDNAAPTLVRADSEPLKVRPENPGGASVPNVDSQAYERVAAGEAAAAPEQKQLVTASEEPVSLAAQPSDENGLPGVDDEIAELDALPNPKSEDRIEAEEVAVAGNDQNVLAVQPRRVRTMVVRPDGTLVPREDAAPAAAGTPEAPRPDALAQTAANAVREITTAPAAQPAIPAPRQVETVRVTPERAAEPAAPARPAANTAPAANAAPARPAAPAPAPQPRETQVAQAAPAQARNAPAAPAAPAAAGEWSMQIASQPTAEGAQSTYQDLARRYGSVIGGRGVNIVKADIPGKGTYYRVRIPSTTRAEAISLCERYKSAGGSCFVSK